MKRDYGPDDLIERVDVCGSCWEWRGVISWNGYGRWTMNGRQMQAHRAAWQLLIGDIPPGHDLDHLCRNRRCVNPDHLEPVTRSENLRRSPLVGRMHGLKTHCKHGHERTPENTLVRGRGTSQCRICAREWSRRTREKRRAT